jgi:hypothetical protein
LERCFDSHLLANHGTNKTDKLGMLTIRRYGPTFALSPVEGLPQVTCNANIDRMNAPVRKTATSTDTHPLGASSRHSSRACARRTVMQDNNRARKRLRPRYYSVGLAIPGMSRPVALVVTALSRREAFRQARGMLTGIKIRIMPPGC